MLADPVLDAPRQVGSNLVEVKEEGHASLSSL
jgi:hypothetical protein